MKKMHIFCLAAGLYSSLIYTAEFEDLKNSYNRLITLLTTINDQLKSQPAPMPQQLRVLHVPTLTVLQTRGLLPHAGLKRENLKSTIQFYGYTIRQINVVNQFTLAEKSGMQPAACGVIALYNALNMNGYIKTGNTQFLDNLLNIEKATQFVRAFPNTQWLDGNEMQERLESIQSGKLFNELTPFSKNVLVVPTVVALNKKDKHYESLSFELSDKERERAQNAFRCLDPSFTEQPECYQSFIIGTGEMAQMTGRGHWYTITCVKQAIQKKHQWHDLNLIIMDSAPEGFHVTEKTQDSTHIENYSRLEYFTYFFNDPQGFEANLIKYIQGQIGKK